MKWIQTVSGGYMYMARKTEDLGTQEKRLLEGLYLFYQKGQLTDVTLDVGGQKFACNRNVLAASSPFFRYLSGIEINFITHKQFCY